MIDSTSVRCHRLGGGAKGGLVRTLLVDHAAALRARSTPAREPQAFAAHYQGRPLRFILTGGEASDYTAAEPLMDIPVATPRALLADKGYDGDHFRASLLIRGILPIIPPRFNRSLRG